jgi:hypothetical protein
MNGSPRSPKSDGLSSGATDASAHGAKSRRFVAGLTTGAFKVSFLLSPAKQRRDSENGHCSLKITRRPFSNYGCALILQYHNF